MYEVIFSDKAKKQLDMSEIANRTLCASAQSKMAISEHAQKTRPALQCRVFFDKLGRPIQERIIRALERIRIRPEAHVTKLVGDVGYKLRVGDYRIIVDVDKGLLQILIIKVGHRRNIYG